MTYRDFEKWLVRPDTIASAIRELVALGFVEVTRQGYGGAARKACTKSIPLDVYRCLGRSQSRSDRNTRISANCYPRRSRSHCEGCPQKCRRSGTSSAAKNKTPPHKSRKFRPTLRGSVPPHKSWVTGAVSPAPQNVGLYLYLGTIHRSALPQSAVASVSSQTAQTNEPANFTAIGILMKTRGCSFQEAAEHFEKLPDRALEASRRLINPIRASAVSGAKPMEPGT